MAKVIKKYFFFTRVRLKSGKILKPIDGGWYEGTQYFNRKLGRIGELIAPTVPLRIRKK